MSRCQLLLTVFLLFPLNLVADDKEGTLHRLTASVAENEAHYQNLDLDLSSTYSLAGGVKIKFDANEQSHLHSTSQVSILKRGQEFRCRDVTTSLTQIEVGDTENADVFDGHTHRSFWTYTGKEAGTNKIVRSDGAGRVEEHSPRLTNLSRPHMLLLESGCPKVPLSIYMQGEKAVLNYPNPGYFEEDMKLSMTDLGMAEFQGLTCHRILIDTLIGDSQPHNGWELWLAVDRNFIPVRNVAYTYRWSTEIPVAESIVDEWKELRPGVWFPIKAHTVTYDMSTIKQQGKQVPRWEKEYSVDSISLEPKTTAETFTQLEFPPGMKVEHVE